MKRPEGTRSNSLDGQSLRKVGQRKIALADSMPFDEITKNAIANRKMNYPDGSSVKVRRDLGGIDRIWIETPMRKKAPIEQVSRKKEYPPLILPAFISYDKDSLEENGYLILDNKLKFFKYIPFSKGSLAYSRVHGKSISYEENVNGLFRLDRDNSPIIITEPQGDMLFFWGEIDPLATYPTTIDHDFSSRRISEVDNSDIHPYPDPDYVLWSAISDITREDAIIYKTGYPDYEKIRTISTTSHTVYFDHPDIGDGTGGQTTTWQETYNGFFTEQMASSQVWQNPIGGGALLRVGKCYSVLGEMCTGTFSADYHARWGNPITIITDSDILQFSQSLRLYARLLFKDALFEINTDIGDSGVSLSYEANSGAVDFYENAIPGGTDTDMMPCEGWSLTNANEKALAGEPRTNLYAIGEKYYSLFQVPYIFPVPENETIDYLDTQYRQHTFGYCIHSYSNEGINERKAIRSITGFIAPEDGTALLEFPDPINTKGDRVWISADANRLRLVMFAPYDFIGLTKTIRSVE